MKRSSCLVALFAVLACVLAAQSTPPAPSQGVPSPWFFFIQLTDPQFGMWTNNASMEQETANLEFAVATANRLKPAFVVLTGDLVNRAGDEAQVSEYLRIVGRLDPAIRAYHVPGNHDVGNIPTPESLAAYSRRFGPDHYSFRHGSLAGVVLNSQLVFAPEQAPEQAAEQERWLRSELERLRRDGARHIVLFQHHPFFLKDVNEPDQYENIPLARRAKYLAVLQEFGVTHVFAGHSHRNAAARAGDLELVTTGPIGRPLGAGSKSGMRIVTVSERGIAHRWYDLGELPNRVDAPK